MAEETSFKLVAIPPEELTKEEFKNYVAYAAPHALFEEPSMLNEENLESPNFRRYVVTELCNKYSSFAVSCLNL